MKLTFIVFELGAGVRGDQAKVLKIGSGMKEPPLHMMFVKIPTGAGLTMSFEVVSCSKYKQMRPFLNYITVRNETTNISSSLAV
jgi:hypothetical protein